MSLTLRAFMDGIRTLTLVGVTLMTPQALLVSNLLADHTLHLEVPQDYDGQGVVEEIRSDGMVINDIYYGLMPDAEMINCRVLKPSGKKIAKGDRIAFWLNSKGFIRALCLLRKHE